ncbi:MAG: hypothetical protein ACRCS9_11290 [Hyphomicrobium sp.]
MLRQRQVMPLTEWQQAGWVIENHRPVRSSSRAAALVVLTGMSIAAISAAAVAYVDRGDDVQKPLNVATIAR